MSVLGDGVSPPPAGPEADAFRRRQRGRNLALLIALVALAALFYAISIVKFKVS